MPSNRFYNANSKSYLAGKTQPSADGDDERKRLILPLAHTDFGTQQRGYYPHSEIVMECLKQVAAVLAATARIAGAARIDPSYSPSGANVHPPPSNAWFLGPMRVCLPRRNVISIGSAIFAGLTAVTNTPTDKETSRQDMRRDSQRLALRTAVRAKKTTSSVLLVPDIFAQLPRVHLCLQYDVIQAALRAGPSATADTCPVIPSLGDGVQPMCAPV